MINFLNSHLHSLREDKTRQEKEIQSYMENKGFDFHTQGIQLILQEKFGISKRRFLYIKEKKMNIKEDLRDFIHGLKREGHSVVVGDWYEDEPAPEFLLVVSENMRDDFTLFGDCLRFDVTYGLCRLRPVHGSDKWNVGIFSGFTENLTPFPFGVVLIRR